MKGLISCCAMAGIAEWVCCPGPRNNPFLSVLSRCPELHRWTHSDDRAAAYFALGRVQATGRPVALLAGHAAAAAAMAPAVIEAYYQRRPLLIVSMDDTENGGSASAPGCIEQENLFGQYAPDIELQLPCAVSDLPDLSSALAEGFPLHLHVRMGKGLSPQADVAEIDVADPPPAPRFRGSLVALSQMLRFRAHEGLVLLLGALDPMEQEPVLWLAQTLRVPVLAEASSGLREELAPYLLHNGDKLLCKYPPRYVLRVGDVPTGDFWKALEQLPQTEVFSVSRTGFAGLSRKSNVVEGELEQVMKALGDVPHVGDTERLLRHSRQEAGRMEELLLAYPESEAALLRAFSNHASIADVICLGSRSAIDSWNRFAQMQIHTLYLRANCSASGADGTISSFLANSEGAGYAACLTGDLALLRDLDAAVFMPQLSAGKRVVGILNNEGDGSAYRRGMHPELQRLSVQPQPFELEHVARLWGAEYYAIRCEADFEVLDSLDDHCFALLDIQPDLEQTAEFKDRC